MAKHPEIVTLRRPSKALGASVVLPASKSISNRLLIIRALSYYGGPGSQGVSGDRNVATGDQESTGSSNAPQKAGSDTISSSISEGKSKDEAGEAHASQAGQQSATGCESIPPGWLNAINNLSDSDDTSVMMKALTTDDPLKDIGHAGTSMRFLTAYYCTLPGRVVMTGSARMKQRPIGPLVDALLTLGADIRYMENEGYPPLEINGRKLQGGEVHIDGSISSQFISALLMIAPVLERGMKIYLEGEVVSESYIHMTLTLMKACGANWSRTGNMINIHPGNYDVGKFTVESDWSAASYWYAMGLLENHNHILLSYLEEESLQGDCSLTDIFHRLGLVSDFNNQAVLLTKLINLHPGQFEHDFSNSPDLVQALAVALCLAEIPFRFSGTRTLRIKETDRIHALQEELKKLGYRLESDIEGSFLAWNKERYTPEKDPVIQTYHDHRMAMAFAPVALVRGEIQIADPMVVTKSYPDFWKDLEAAGFEVRMG